MTPTNHPERRLRAVYMCERGAVRARAPVISEKSRAEKPGFRRREPSRVELGSSRLRCPVWPSELPHVAIWGLQGRLRVRGRPVPVCGPPRTRTSPKVCPWDGYYGCGSLRVRVLDHSKHAPRTRTRGYPYPQDPYKILFTLPQIHTGLVEHMLA